MNFVMTGHKGLIGTFLLKRLEERGDKSVLLVDKREGTNIIDMLDFKLEEKADMFIHLASFCKINQTIENPELAFDNNVLGIFKVLEFCRKNNIPKIVFTSSSRILSPEKNPYTASKVYGEELVKSYSQCYGIDFVIIRPSTVYGPFNDETERLMDVFMLNALDGKELKIYGDKNKTLDFTYIDDFIDGTLLAMTQRNEDFDISAGKGVRVDYVADLIISLAGRGKKFFYQAEKAQPQEVCLDINKLGKLGYVPKVRIGEGVRKTFEWYKENFDRIQRERVKK
jgi:UDP-glucose 4-epimerase